MPSHTVAVGGPGTDRLRLTSLISAMTALSSATSATSPSPAEVLRGLCRAVALTTPVDGVGVMLARGSALQFVHAQPAWVVEVERLQETHSRGPCWDSVGTQLTVLVDDAGGATQWPELATRAHRPARGDRVGADPDPGFHGIASLPLIAQGRGWGALDLYRLDARPWTADELAPAQACVQVATSQLVLAAERDRWQSAWAEAEHRSTHDELTGLPGRGLLFDRLDHALGTMPRRGGAVAVLFIDVDRFKEVNDAYGHAVGDAALAELAHRLGSTLRSNDTLARMSGDEFVLVCEDLGGTLTEIQHWLHRLGERLLLEVRRPARPGETTIDLAVSIGAAVATVTCTAQHLTARADHAMYAAKHSGGGRMVIARNPLRA